MRGRFITIEGGEGAGKSSCLGELLSALEDADIDYVHTREPGGTPVGERIREMLLDPKTGELAPSAELLLMFASRAQLVSSVIRPSLAAGKWVVSDRFVDASHAYQGGGRGISREFIEALQGHVIGDLKPDMTILLDVPPDTGLRRAVEYRVPDRFEQEQGDFYERIRHRYLELAAEDPDRFRIVDASQPLASVRAAVRRYIEEFIAGEIAGQ